MKKNKEFYQKLFGLSPEVFISLIIKSSFKLFILLLKGFKLIKKNTDENSVIKSIFSKTDMDYIKNHCCVDLYKNCFFFISESELEKTATYKSIIDKEARDWIGRKVKIFSNEQVYLGEIVDWQKDYISNYDWVTECSDIEKRKNADIKYPWELSRFHQFYFLALAFLLKNDTKYSDIYFCDLNDWIEKNKYPNSINWYCAMEVAIRISNLLVSIELINKRSPLEIEQKIRLLKLVGLHTYYIRTHLEYNELIPSNHYLADIVGLFFVGRYFPYIEYFQKQTKYAKKNLVKEIKKQIQNDGTDHEASTCYHRLVLELLFYTSILAEKHNINSAYSDSEKVSYFFGEDFQFRLISMFAAILYLLKPNGEMPQIGDNDSGQFIKLYPRKVLDMRYLLSLGAVFFEKPEFKITEFFKNDEDIAELLILYGEEGKKKWDALPCSSLNDIKSHAFKDSGWYIMRNNNNYCIISCGPNGQNDFGGHAHNDKLSFELFMNGEEIIVDPGTYVYTPEPEMRNLFRSTRYHNTVMIDQEEQNRFVDGELFVMRNDAKAKCLEWQVGDIKDKFVGEHYGYKRLKNPVIHRREIVFNKIDSELHVIDSFTGSSMHLFEWNFILFPGMSEKIKLLSDSINLNKEKCYYSPEYGVKMDTEKISFKLSKTLPFKILITIDKELNFKAQELC